MRKLKLFLHVAQKIFLLFYLKTCFCLFNAFAVPYLDLVHVEFKGPFVAIIFFHY